MGKTNIDKQILYKKDYKKLSDYRERLQKSHKAQIAYQLGYNDLEFLKKLYKKYYPKEVLDENCGRCLMKMINKIYNLIVRTERIREWN